MPDDPKSPELARAFLDAQKQGVHKDVSREDYAFDPDKFPDIPTSAEKQQLEASRDTPELNYPAPGDWHHSSTATAKSDEVAEREERIEFLRDRLAQEQEKFEQEIDQSFDI